MDGLSPLLIGAVVSLAILAMREQLRAHNARTQWRLAGLGFEDQETGLQTLAAVPVQFPIELEIARSMGMQLGVTVFRIFGGDATAAGAALRRAMRTYEHAYRFDYNIFVSVVLVKDRAEAVVAVARLGRILADAGCTAVDVGAVMCPEDESDFMRACDRATMQLAEIGEWSRVAELVRTEVDPAERN